MEPERPVFGEDDTVSEKARRLIAANKRTRDKALDLGGCALTKVPAEVRELERLQVLNLAGNELLADLAPLAGLSAVQIVLAYHTQVSDLAPLVALPALRMLDVSRTPVRDLSPLAGLSALQTLDVSNTEVRNLSPLTSLLRRGLPVKWSSWDRNGIYVKDCPLINPPPEIARQGNDAILNYFAERAKGGVDHLYEAKMLILGEGRAGKTSLLTRLYRPDQLRAHNH
jgi:internalin A